MEFIIIESKDILNIPEINGFPYEPAISKHFSDPVIIRIPTRFHCQQKHKFTTNPLPFIKLKYEKYDQYILLKDRPNKFILEYLKLNFKLIMLKCPIKIGSIRQPNHEILYSVVQKTEFFTSFKQNGIKYYWNPFFTMFSAGNIGERIRMSKLEIKNEFIVDLYCGIGYFILPMLRNNQAIACDLNPYSIHGLKRAVQEMGLESHIQIFQGDHAVFVEKYKERADRILMGYLPCPFSSLEYAILGLKKKGGVIHFHKAIEKENVISFSEVLKEKLKVYFEIVEIKNIEKVKLYSPKVYHYVYDIILKNKYNSN
ncbi:tRNA wybutosine-synthesizing protein 2/3/4 [Astathelohania contejeani]|uniref:tRNA wybutosine-synthesizing protein 2/3/4 n=1 Tax=Astathelohania contejeani TaxID=164912 RepID=A0ABQ7I0W7_9MICR|nr:tRNA wybutosine-synthesizing protein 2/3/4 [Thelohania contejeani]